MRLKNPTGHPVLLPTIGAEVEAGGSIDVTGDVAASLKAQGWTTARSGGTGTTKRPTSKGRNAKPRRGKTEAPASDQGDQS